MSHYLAFLKKEVMEGFRTYKVLIMVLVFAAFGILSPLTAKMTPVLLDALAEEFTISLPEPAAIDSWTQFFKNIAQMGIIVVVIVFGGILATELSRGTLINMLTKGLSRVAVILSKYTYMVLIWTVCLLICFIITFAYTSYLWPNDEVRNLVFSVFCLWLFGVFILSILLFSATLVRGMSGCLLMTGGSIVVMLIISIWPAVEKYNPLSLASFNVQLLMDTYKVTDLFWSIGVAAVLSVIFVTTSIILFRKKQL
ncbi:MAG: ABC transporter permease [Coriobacteriales bacterium]|jgi:ABC-2 type transport system permease protein|nr:ABC transporter permease [Coriobacteriales bacterium]